MEDIGFLCMANSNFLLYAFLSCATFSFSFFFFLPWNRFYFVDPMAFTILELASSKKNIILAFKTLNLLVVPPDPP